MHKQLISVSHEIPKIYKCDIFFFICTAATAHILLMQILNNLYGHIHENTNVLYMKLDACVRVY